MIDKAHPLYDERVHDPIDDAMVRNIMAVGIIQPIVIARDWETGQNFVVAGRQRVKCAREVNRRLRERGEAIILVPAVIRKIGDDAGKELAAVAVSENEIRRADTAMVKARKMQHLEKMGHDVDAIALHFGINALTVRNHLALVGCASAVQKAVEGGFVGITDVTYLSRLTPSQQTAKVAELVRATAGKVGHAKAKAKREVVQGKPAAPKLKTRKEIIQRISDELVKAGCVGAHLEDYPTAAQALAWVLGEVISEPETDTKTANLFDASKAAETVA